MDNTSQNRFLCLDKFEDVIKVLESRGWTRTFNIDESNLIFTNLAGLDFKALAARDEKIIVNHFRGAQHLSNKSFLAYHMTASNLGDLMPQQWSAAYEDLMKLISLVLCSSLYNHCNELLTRGECSGPEELANIETLAQIVRALQMDNEWSQYEDVCQAVKLVELLRTSKGVNMSASISEALAAIDVKNPWRKSWAGGKDVWIVKPVGGSCGERIHVVHGLQGVLGVARNMAYKCIVQKYIERPLLVRRTRKFDIRQWILIKNINPLILYGFSECYLRLSSQDYSLDVQHFSDPKVHLCNHAIQKHSGTIGTTTVDSKTDHNVLEKGKLKGEGKDGGDGGGGGEGESIFCNTMMTQAQFNDELIGRVGGSTPFLDIIKPKIKNIAVKVIQSVRDKIVKVGNGFEWLGLDLMVLEENLDVLLLEVNVSPDVSHSTPVTSRLVTAAVSDLFRVVLDEDELENPRKLGIGGGVISDTHREVQNEDKGGRTNIFSQLSNLTTSNENQQSALQWELWYKADSPESFSSIRSFAKSKADKFQLGTDYTPRKEVIAQRVWNILEPKEIDEKAEASEDEI